MNQKGFDELDRIKKVVFFVILFSYVCPSIDL